MSDCERIAQVSHDKRATMSDSLRSLIINERMSESLICSFAHKKRFAQFFLTKIVFKKNMSDSLIPSFLKSNVSESIRSLSKNERCERIAQVAQQKWANERIARFFEQIAHLLIFRKKRAIHSENQWANSQPWFILEAVSENIFILFWSQVPTNQTEKILLNCSHILCTTVKHFAPANFLLKTWCIKVPRVYQSNARKSAQRSLANINGAAAALFIAWLIFLLA